MQQGASSEENNDPLIDLYSLVSSGRQFTSYFSSRIAPQRRCSDYVLMVNPLEMLRSSKAGKVVLTNDSDQILSMAKNTISMLSNQGKKVAPRPIIVSQPEVLLVGLDRKPYNKSDFEQEELPKSILDELCSLTAKLSITDRVPNICAERQFDIHFHIVGHGTPHGVGNAHPLEQVGPADLADLLNESFNVNLLCHKLKHTRFVIEFHCCNSAYAELEDSFDFSDVQQAILKESFIGKFYNSMVALGYDQIEVIGYRGWYSSITTNNASSARVQDHYYNPTLEMSAESARYVIAGGTCKLPYVTLEKLKYPVDLDGFYAPVERVLGSNNRITTDVNESDKHSKKHARIRY